MSDQSSPFRGAPSGYEELNRYSRIIVDEALRRGIAVEVVDADIGELVLSQNGRSVTTIESLSEMTSAVAFRRCDDKLHSRRIFAEAGLRVPAGQPATFDDDDARFLDRWKNIVVKPVRGEGGEGVTVGVVDREQLNRALATARAVCPEVLLERRCEGVDVRVVVIDGEVVAASVRRPPIITGDGRQTVGNLVDDLSQTRAEATGGAADVPLDDATLDAVRADGFDFESVLPDGDDLAVRRTANVHTGGTIRDVTDQLHPFLAEVAVRAAQALDIPVVGVDLMVPAVDGSEYSIIEANEQPGLANHEPQPTVERFLDLLFPGSAP